jgi:hypothetical protein
MVIDLNVEYYTKPGISHKNCEKRDGLTKEMGNTIISNANHLQLELKRD